MTTLCMLYNTDEEGGEREEEGGEKGTEDKKEESPKAYTLQIQNLLWSCHNQNSMALAKEQNLYQWNTTENPDVNASKQSTDLWQRVKMI